MSSILPGSTCFRYANSTNDELRRAQAIPPVLYDQRTCCVLPLLRLVTSTRYCHRSRAFTVRRRRNTLPRSLAPFLLQRTVQVDLVDAVTWQDTRSRLRLRPNRLRSAVRTCAFEAWTVSRRVERGVMGAGGAGAGSAR